MSERSTFSPFPLIDVALDHARLLIGVPLGASLVAVALGLVLGGSYTAESSFKPQGEQADINRLSGLAAQFGIDVPGAGRGEPVDFYARLARSRALLEDVARREYRTADESLPATLIELYEVSGDGAERLRAAVDELAGRIAVDTDLNAGVIGIRTRDPDAAVAEQINRAILDEVNRFNLERRQSQAAAERQFVEGEAERARRELETAEQELSAFMQSNRRYEEWPELRFEAARLQRRVDIQQQVLASLTQSLERARLDEVRNTPVITIIDHPEGSSRRERKLVQKAILGALMGLTLVLAWLFVRDYMNRLRMQYPEEYARLRQRTPWVAALVVVALAGCDGSTVEPVEVPLSVVMVTAGANHSCALTDAGAAYCWGRGLDGELGNGALASSSAPVPVVTPLRFRTISAGHAHTCALTEDGTPYCWGWNAYFQRGNPVDTATGRPVAVGGDHRFASLDAGANHTCALKVDGTAWCWGYNRFGQLGDGTSSTQVTPMRVLTEQRFNVISAGGNHTCALATNSTGPNVHCWGLNSTGQLAAGTDTVVSTTPVPANGGRRFERISAGYDHTCALGGGQLYCWGGNAHGQLADGTSFPEGIPGSTMPVPSRDRGSFFQVTAGLYMGCALAGDGRAHCWGKGNSGQLGIGTTVDHYLPQAVHLQPGGQFRTELLRFRTISAGAEHTCGSTLENVVFCWGNGTLGQIGVTDAFYATLPRRVPITE